MKRRYFLLLSFLFVVATAISQPYQVIVQGHIKFANGTPAANWPVTVSSDTMNTSLACYQVHNRTTNANGFYSDTLSCSNSAINSIRVFTYNCNQSVLVNSHTAITTPKVESNFRLSCNPPSTNSCIANFQFTKAATPFTVNFNSSSSKGSSITDSIVSRHWYFGDGDSLQGNVVNPTHVYSRPGNFRVCLRVRTAAGCEKTECKNVIFDSIAGNHMVIIKGYVKGPNGQPLVNQPVFSAVDSTYPYNSNCNRQPRMRVTNANGFYIDTLYCSSAVITHIKVWTSNCNGAVITRWSKVPPSGVVENNFTSCVVTCNASFNVQANNTVAYVVSNSTPSQGGTINSYKWDFGDGTPIVTSTSPSSNHVYAAPGSYRIRLKILGSNNCEDTTSRLVHIQASVGCQANFRDSIVGKKVYFFGNPHQYQSDSLVTHWSFGDGTSVGNVRNPVHQYTSAGSYLVCLTIKTQAGCIDSICKNIIIRDTTPATNCNAVFAFGYSNNNQQALLFNSSNSSGAPGDAVVNRRWSFGDGTVLNGNVVAPDHHYQAGGIYNVCLKITTASGCVKEYCRQVQVKAPTCHASFTFSPAPSSASGYAVKFNSITSSTSAGDSIREKIWKFGDGTSAVGNEPVHVYSTAGSYTVCLIIRTKAGCSDTVCKTIQVPLPGQVNCTPYFSFAPQANNVVQFNSQQSAALPGDSIIKRVWNFGDSTILQGNVVNPNHTYRQPGVYNVCLRIITRGGCEKTICKQVITSSTSSNCLSRFTFQRSAPKQVMFNSSMSWSASADSIIERKWSFGDGSPVLTGNVINPVKNYYHPGNYTVCLQIKTRSGCQNNYCLQVNAQDTVVNNPEPIKIVRTYPNPATVQLNTAVWSRHNNVNAELAIYDIYGVKKWSIQKVLVQGDNYTVLPVAALAPGPYFFRVTTMYGVRSKQFYKL